MFQVASLLASMQSRLKKDGKEAKNERKRKEIATNMRESSMMCGKLKPSLVANTHTHTHTRVVFRVRREKFYALEIWGVYLL